MKKILLITLLFTGLNAAQFEDNKRLCDDDANTIGCYNLGIMYMNGTHGATKDEDKAIEYFRKACNGGDIDGCFTVGKYFEDGIGVKKDLHKSIEFYTKGCDGEDAFSCMTLGIFYRDGKGVQEDHLKAAEYFKKVCDSGYSEGCKQYEILKKNNDMF
jgi:TPR repeat protein